MTRKRSTYLAPGFLALSIAAPLPAEESPALEEIQAYLDFATYSDGTISLEQLSGTGQEILFIDSRSSEQFSQAHIPGAVNIEWREALSRRDEVPTDKPVVFYCNTGTLSAKAQFMLRLAGRENVKVLHGGFDAWKRQQAAGKSE